MKREHLLAVLVLAAAVLSVGLLWTVFRPFLVGDAYVRYLAPIPLRTRVELGIRFASIGNKSFVLDYQVRNADTGQVMAEARTTQVMVDNEGRTYPVPDEVRRKAAELGVPDAWPKAPGA